MKALSHLMNNKSYPRIPPASLVAILFSIVLLFSFLTYHKITNQPWMGITFDTQAASGDGLLIKSVQANSPAHNKIKPGDTLVAITSAENSLKITPLSLQLIKSPLNLRTLSEYQHIISQHTEIAKMLANGSVHLSTQDGRIIRVTPQNKFPVSAIPLPTILFFVSNLIGIIIGTLVWMRFPGKEIGIYLFTMGVAYYGHSTGSLLMVRELSLNDIHTIASFENFFSLLFGVSLITSIIHYPIKIYSLWCMLPLASLSVLLWLNGTFMISDIPFHTFFFQFILFYPFFFFFSYKQWQASKSDPLKKAACSAFLLFITIFVITAVTFYIVPMVFSLPSILGHDSAKLLMGSIFIGFAIGIFKFRLFNVEKWWFKVWLWFLGGMLIIMMDLLLVYSLQINKIAALSISIIAVGFIYFPFRQWLFQKLLPTSEHPIQDYIPKFMQTINDNLDTKGFEQSWYKVLKNRYQPINIDYYRQNRTCSLVDNGMIIHVPGSCGQGYYELTGKNNGTRLFNKKDIEDVGALHQLISLIDQTSNKHHELRLQERRAIMGDLHDTVGANLLTLAHRQQDPKQADYIHSTLQNLRETIRLSTSEETLTLETSIADWRSEANERCELANIELRWNSEAFDASSTALNVIQIVTLTQVLREAITNAIKHAHPSYIDVTISQINAQLELIVRNDGKIAEKSAWKEGIGLQNMRSRVAKQQGDLEITVHNGQVFLMVTLPISLEAD